ncbi:unnamed protein product, partial [Effrenium voratum]
HQTVHFGDRPCAVLEAETSGEQLVCETSAGLAGGPALPVCLRLSAAGPCEPACESCSFQYAEEETPYISWLSARGFCGGDSVALGAAAPQALLVAQLDRAVVEIGGYICDASEGQVLNSDDLLVQGRTVNCVLPSTGLGPRLARVQLRALARGWQDPGCANFPCLEGGEDERGLGLAAYRTWQGGAELAPAFVDRGFQLYDLTIFPQIANVTPGSVGVLGGTLLHIAGKSFDEEVSRNVVTVADEPCRVLSAGPDGLTCELDDVQGNLSCAELELYAGASPHASEKFLEHDGDLSSCRVEQLADGRSFSVAVNASESYGYYWVEDSCQADGRHVRGHLAEESEERLTFCCTLNGSSCVGPRYGQVTTSIPSYWQGWGSWVQMGGGTTTPDPLFGTCLPPTSHKEAELTCQLTGMRLCSKVELNSGLCCAADCFGDGSATIGAWSSDSGQRQQLAVSADDGQPWTEELYIRCEEACRFPFNVTFPGNGTTTTTTRYTPEQLALWEFAPWLRPADFVPPTQAEEEILPLGPPVPEPLLPPSPPLLAPFAGGRGLLYKVYSNSENLPVHRALGHENAAYPQSPMASGVLPDMLRGAFRHVRFAPVPATAVSARRSYVPEPPLSDDTGHDLYAEEIVGFFVAPFTASYIFYLAADDEADLSISCCGDMAGMKVEVKASSRDYPMPRYTPLAWFGACEAGMDVPCSISAPHHFRAGEQTLLRVRHRDNVAGDWLRVGLRIHNALAHDGSTVPAELVRRKSIVEVQRLTLTASVVRERHQLNFYRILTGSFRIHVRRYARNFLREGTSDSLRYGDTADQFATALWATQDLYGRVLECQPTVERQQSGERISYVVTFPCPQPEDGNSHAALQLVPGLDVIGTSVLSWVMNSSKLQTSSGLVRGSFRLYFGRGWTEALPYYGWAQVQSELTRLPGLAAVTTWPLQEVQQGGREGWSVGLLLPGAGGGEDMPQIQVDASELSGPGVHLTVDTLANGSSDLFLEEIPADWFRTPHSQQQVVVESNGVRAAGLGEAGAALRRSEDFTPRLMELSPWRVQVGAEVILRLDRVDGNHLRSLKIAPFTLMIGPVLCNMTSFSCENGEERNCGAYPEVWNARCTVPDGRAGQHAVQVLVEGQGRAQYTNVTVALPVPVIDYVPELHLVRPGRGSWAGGTVVLLAGFGLQGPEACQLIHFGASALLEVPMDYFEEEMVPELPGRLLRCLTPPAPEVPEACEISPGWDCGPAEDLVVPVTVAGYATDWSFNYSSDVTPLVSAISPQRSAAMSGMVSLQGARFPPLRGGRAADPVVVYIGSQRCRPEESTGASLRCFLLRHPPVPSGQSAVGLWVLGLGFAVVTPSTRFSHPFAVTEVSPASGSWHGGALLEIRGEGFHAESARHEVLLRLAVNGSQDLPCPLLPGPTLGRRLQCQDMSSEPFERLKAKLSEEVQAGAVAGACHLVLRNGRRVFAHAKGAAKLGRTSKAKAFGLKTLCKLHGCSKPLVSMAFLLLVQQGRVKLDDPVAQYLTFPDVRAIKAKTKAKVKVRKVQQQPTLRHLLTMTAGLQYQDCPAYGAVMRRIRRKEIRGLEAMCDALGQRPLQSEPGARYAYSFCTDFVGRVCEVVSGQRLDKFLETILLKPLQMRDTHFVVPAKKRKRQATLYDCQPVDGSTCMPKVWEHPERADGIMSAGGGILSYHDAGIWSTAADYAKFCQMLLTGLSPSGKQILEPGFLKSLWRDGLVDYGRKDGRLPGWHDSPGAMWDFTGWSLLNTHLTFQDGPQGRGRKLGQTMWMGGGGGTYWVVDRRRQTVSVSFCQSFGGRGDATDEAKDASIFTEAALKRRRR